jgi:uncharacterized YccA/Bax inhibitor family protein
MIFESGNPTLNANTFTREGGAPGRLMTLNGTVNKTGILLLLLCATGSLTWGWAIEDPAKAGGFAILGLIVGLIAALATSFKPEWSGVSAPVYALAEGLALGGVSAVFNARYHGIVVQAVGLTVCVLGAMLFLYRSRIIQPTARFQMGLCAAMGGLMLLYFINFILSFFGHGMPFIFGNGLMGIGFSLVVVVIAALSLIMDFGVIEQGIDSRAPAYMEWYGGFALLVTLVWLYISLLQLLAQLQNRRD